MRGRSNTDTSFQAGSQERIGVPAAADLHAQVAQMANSFAICDADCLDAPFRPVLQDLVHHTCSTDVLSTSTQARSAPVPERHRLMTKSLVYFLHETVSWTGYMTDMPICVADECGHFAFVNTGRACYRCCRCLAVYSAVITEQQPSTATADCMACMMGHHCAGVSPAITFVFQADEQCSGQASEHKRILGTVLADCRHVHNRQQLFDVVQQ